MKYKGYIIFAIIALMLLINLGNVYAVNYKRLSINSSTYSSPTGNIVINYTNSNVPHIDLGNFWQRNMPSVINSAYTIYDDAKLSVFIIYFPNKLNESSKSVLDSTLSESFYDGKASNIFTSNDFEDYCGDSRQDLVAQLEAKGLEGIDFTNIFCRYDFYDPATGVLNITSDDYKNKSAGAFYVYLLRYNVLNNFSINEHINANLQNISETGENKYTAQFIHDETKIFTNENYFATSAELVVGSSIKEESTTPPTGGKPVEDEQTGSASNKESQSLAIQSTSSGSTTATGITLTPVSANGEGYICDNHVCYYTQKYINNTYFIQFNVSGKTGDICYYSNASNENWKNDASKLNNCNTLSTYFEIGLNISKKVTISSGTPIETNHLGSINPNTYLLVGTPSNYDYYFFVYVSDINSSSVDIYKINNRKLIDFYGGSLPEWIPGITGGVTDTTISEDCKLFDKMLCSFRMVNLSDDIDQTGITSKGQIVTTSDANLEMTIKIKYDSLNFTKDNEVIKDMNDLVTKLELTEEQHAVWFAIVGSESNFNKNVTVGTDGVSYGIGQVNVTTWGNSGIDYLKTHPKVISAIKKAGITINTNQDYIDFVNSTKTDHKKGLILSAAIFLESRDKLQTEFTKKGITDIDKPNGSIDLAINTAFGSFYQYMVGSDVGAKNFPNGIPAANDYYPYKVHDGAGELDSWSVYASMRKTAYYLYFYNHFMDIYHPGYWK